MRRPTPEPNPDAARPGRNRAALGALGCLLVAVGVLVAACGGGSASPPAGIEDPAATANVSVPEWYAVQFRPPAGSVPVESIEQPEPGFGRTVTWRVPGSFDATLQAVERSFRSLGWAPTDRQDTNEGGSRRTSYRLENDQVYAVQVYADDTLAGVRLTVELTAAR